MKINVAIVGYGNLGKAVEEIILKDTRFNLITIFSRRTIVSKFKTKIEPYDNYINYINKIDVMLLCGGSKSDLELQTPEISKYFDTINTFDTHAKIPMEYKKLDSIAKEHNHRVIMSCGWDPGLFSVIRGLFLAISNKNSYTFWGKGISMGHSDAIRRVDGVDDGVQFTVPNKKAIILAKKGLLEDNIPMHFRECYICTDSNNKKTIERKIKNIPNYFKGQPTDVRFVDKLKLLKLKSNMGHKGRIINNFFATPKNKCSMEFCVSMESNPIFTASIMKAYIIAIQNLKKENKTGAFTTLDIPISYLFDKKDYIKLLHKIC